MQRRLITMLDRNKYYQQKSFFHLTLPQMFMAIIFIFFI